MCLRIFSSLLAFGTLSACGAAQSPEPEGESVQCAIGAGAELADVCTLEWVDEAGGGEFLIHHPDGGFRRFTVNEDASGVTLKDGAEELEMSGELSSGIWQFSVSGDRYVMPVPPASGA